MGMFTRQGTDSVVIMVDVVWGMAPASEIGPPCNQMQRVYTEAAGRSTHSSTRASQPRSGPIFGLHFSHMVDTWTILTWYSSARTLEGPEK